MSCTLPHDARSLLSRGMTRYQQLLNARLIDLLLDGFHAWRRQLHPAPPTPPTPGQAMQRGGGGTEKTGQVAVTWPIERRRPECADARQLLDYLMLRARDELDGLQRLAVRHADFCQAMAQSSAPHDRQQLVLGYARDLGGGRRERRQIERATRRWFSEQALVDRYQRRRGEAEQRLTFALERLGWTVEHCLGLMKPRNWAAFWDRLRLERLLRSIAEYEGDVRVHVAAVRCLLRPLQSVGYPAAAGLLSARTLAYLRQVASEPARDVWLQCGALSLLTVASQDRGLTLLRQRLTSPQGGDDLFVRRHVVRLLPSLLGQQDVWDSWCAGLADDPSPFVRQELAATLWQAPLPWAVFGLRRLALQDPSPQVRAAALVTGWQRMDRSELRPILLELLQEVLAREQHEFVLRCAMHVASHWGEPSDAGRSACEPAPPAVAAAVRETVMDEQVRAQIVPRLRCLQGQASSIPVRRWAAECAERIWMRSHPAASALYGRLRARASRLKPGARCRLPGSWFRDLDQAVVGRTLAVLSQEDFGYDLQPGWWGYRLVKLPVFRFRLWRAWYEFRNPATDKRQAFRHTIGRVSAADVCAPSRIMGELSQTKVPGEPLHMAADGTWRSFLPLPDDFISLLKRSLLKSRSTRVYSAEGVTEVHAPRSLLRSLWALAQLTFKFPAYASARNWEENSAGSSGRYVQSLRQLGFRIGFRPYADERGQPVADDGSVKRFFPGVMIPFGSESASGLARRLQDYVDYFGSAFENSLVHLVLFTAAFLVLFLGKHALANIRVRRARRAIPLSLGGWGTRGKSGTERLKAALLVTQGHGLVSKTTGCEAMFIQAHAFGEPLEIPLFRPYDKATIWEHANLLRLAAAMRPSVFLWECMGLTPAYVDVLQRQWTRDDLATITNTYPDHEDIQGPAGFNVATTIAGFVPRHSRVITTEQQMRPILQASCDRVGTELRGVGWLESGLIPDDILDRFPYKEHPDNIALVAAMAQELGCPYEEALKGMADNLVPDLGVLKTFPESLIRSRRIEFTNGMSANERFGTLGNWKRTGYDQHDPYEQPDVWLSTVVNNRADRVARSRVFASILVHDIEADRHFLIGGNLKGLLGFIWEAWEQHEQELTLLDEQRQWNPQTAEQTWARAAKRFRQPTAPQHVQQALRGMLQPIVEATEPLDALIQEAWNNPQQLGDRLSAWKIDEHLAADVVRHQQRLLQGLREYEELAAAIRQTTSSAEATALELRFRSQLRTWFAHKLIVIENYDATGEEIIRDIVQQTPPGFRNRVMGIQNIKGTGLDFVYRFQAWDACYHACQQLSEPDLQRVRKGLQQLNELPIFGQLCQAQVQASLQQLRLSPAAGHPEVQTQLEAAQQKLDDSRRQLEQSLAGGAQNKPQQPGWLRTMVRTLEQFLDVQDALRRRQQADRIYRDFQRELIGRQQAVEEIRLLNKRQKGGWLKLPLHG